MEANPRPARVVCFGEILLRLASRAPGLLLQDAALEASFCGAEANVAVALAGFGHDSRLVSALPDSPLGANALGVLRGLGVECSGVLRGLGRMGLFFLQPGAMSRAPQIVYDRSGSVFAQAEPGQYDWPDLLMGADWLYVSGITAALGDQALESLRSAIVAARDAGVRVAFDTNFRPTLWERREEEAANLMREFACASDLLFAGRRAVAIMTGASFEEGDPDTEFCAAAKSMFEIAPNLAQVAATRREILTSDSQRLTGLLADRSGLSTSGPLALDAIVDRVGTGDAFAAGIVHGVATGANRDETIDFAVACSSWAHSVRGDFLRASLADIASLSNVGDVRR